MWKLSFAAVFLFLGVAFVGAAGAQTLPTIKAGTTYECPLVRARIKVFSCAGAGDSDMCDVQTYFQGNPQSSRGKSPRQQVNSLLRFCHAQTAEEAKVTPAMPPTAAEKGK